MGNALGYSWCQKCRVQSKWSEPTQLFKSPFARLLATSRKMKKKLEKFPSLILGQIFLQRIYFLMDREEKIPVFWTTRRWIGSCLSWLPLFVAQSIKRLHFNLLLLPFTLPATFRYSVEGWIQAVRVVADVTVITEQQSGGVRCFPTNFAHNALHTAPALQQHHLGNLNRKEKN